MLNQINRGAVIITPKQTFFDMIEKISGKPADKAISPLTPDESTVYLIADDDSSESDLKNRMESCYKEIFFEELEGWYTDESQWPQDVSWKEFMSYFHISFQSMVLDTLDEEIEYE